MMACVLDLEIDPLARRESAGLDTIIFLRDWPAASRREGSGITVQSDCGFAVLDREV